MFADRRPELFLALSWQYATSELHQASGFKARLSAKLFDTKMIFFILMQIKLIFTRKILHFDPFSEWEFLELGNSVLRDCLGYYY